MCIKYIVNRLLTGLQLFFFTIFTVFYGQNYNNFLQCSP